MLHTQLQSWLLPSTDLDVYSSTTLCVAPLTGALSRTSNLRTLPSSDAERITSVVCAHTHTHTHTHTNTVHFRRAKES